MRTVVDVATMEELLNHINKVQPADGRVIDKVSFKHIGYDERCAWETYYVKAVLYGTECVIGMSDEFME